MMLISALHRKTVLHYPIFMLNLILYLTLTSGWVHSEGDVN